MFLQKNASVVFLNTAGQFLQCYNMLLQVGEQQHHLLIAFAFDLNSGVRSDKPRSEQTLNCKNFE